MAARLIVLFGLIWLVGCGEETVAPTTENNPANAIGVAPPPRVVEAEGEALPAAMRGAWRASAEKTKNYFGNARIDQAELEQLAWKRAVNSQSRVEFANGRLRRQASKFLDWESATYEVVSDIAPDVKLKTRQAPTEWRRESWRYHDGAIAERRKAGDNTWWLVYEPDR